MLGDTSILWEIVEIIASTKRTFSICFVCALAHPWGFEKWRCDVMLDVYPTHSKIKLATLPKINIAPTNGGFQGRSLLFQRSIFRGELLNFRCVFPLIDPPIHWVHQGLQFGDITKSPHQPARSARSCTKSKPLSKASFLHGKNRRFFGLIVTTMGFPTKNDHFGVLWGYHHLRKHPHGTHGTCGSMVKMVY